MYICASESRIRFKEEFVHLFAVYCALEKKFLFYFSFNLLMKLRPEQNLVEANRKTDPVQETRSIPKNSDRQVCVTLQCLPQKTNQPTLSPQEQATMTFHLKKNPKKLTWIPKQMTQQ